MVTSLGKGDIWVKMELTVKEVACTVISPQPDGKGRTADLFTILLGSY